VRCVESGVLVLLAIAIPLVLARAVDLAVHADMAGAVGFVALAGYAARDAAGLWRSVRAG
jgi:hypothetical protein